MPRAILRISSVPFRAELDVASSRRPVPFRRSVSLAKVLCLGCASVALVTGAPRHSSAQWIPYTSNSRNVLEGNWQSCPDRQGRYDERVYDHVVAGAGQYEVHLGPKREFAIFPGVQDVHREHGSPENLLKPYRVPMEGSRARQHWDIPSLKLALTVTMGGGSRTDCESWYIVLEPLEKSSE
jgi:hypothetical protein